MEALEGDPLTFWFFGIFWIFWIFWIFKGFVGFQPSGSPKPLFSQGFVMSSPPKPLFLQGLGAKALFKTKVWQRGATSGLMKTTL